MKLLIFNFLLLVSMIQWVQCTHPWENAYHNCTEVEALKGYTDTRLGWPRSIGCRFFTDDAYSPGINTFLKESNVLLCQLWSYNGTILLNATEEKQGIFPATVIEVANENDTKDFQLFLFGLPAGNCFSAHLRLNVSLPAKADCKSFSKLVFSYLPKRINSTLKLPCHGDGPPIPPHPGITYRWFLDCEVLPQFNSFYLWIPAVSFENVGTYTCAAVYQRRILMVRSEPVCVRYTTGAIRPTLKCASNLKSKMVGENVTVNCNASYGMGSIDPDTFYVGWTKNLSFFTQCRYRPDVKKQERIMCIYENYDPCFKTRKEVKPGKAEIYIQFTIRDIKEQDFGDYYFTTESNRRLKANYTVFHLEENIEKSLNFYIVVTTMSCVVCVALIIAILLIHRNRSLIRLMAKKLCFPPEIDDKSYGAVLWYNYSQDNDGFSQAEVKIAVKQIRAYLEDLKYQIYDDHKDDILKQFRQENIQTVIEKSHRTIIFLTSNFIRDDWNMLALNKSFMEMIVSKSKMIFILPPGMPAYLKQKSAEGDDVCRVIQRAIKVNFSILWQDNRKFKIMLKLAMPKLRGDKNANNNQYAPFLNAKTPSEVAASDCVRINDENQENMIMNAI